MTSILKKVKKDLWPLFQGKGKHILSRFVTKKEVYKVGISLRKILKNFEYMQVRKKVPFFHLPNFKKLGCSLRS